MDVPLDAITKGGANVCGMENVALVSVNVLTAPTIAIGHKLLKPENAIIFILLDS